MRFHGARHKAGVAWRVCQSAASHPLLWLRSVRALAWARRTVDRGDLGAVLRLAMAPSPAGGAADAARAEELAGCVMLLARLPPLRATCLARSLAIWRLAAGSGQPARLRIGVTGHGASFAAHAWVEAGARVVGDRPDVAARFRPLEGAERA